MTGHDEPGPAERAGQYAEAVTTGWAADPAHRAGGGPAPGPRQALRPARTWYSTWARRTRPVMACSGSG